MNEIPKLSELLKDKKYGTVCSYLNNDVKILENLIRAIGDNSIKNISSIISKEELSIDVNTLSNYKEAFFICCVYSIVSNPFNFQQFLNENDFNILLNFCIGNIKKHDIGKLAIKSIVSLNKEKILLEKRDGCFYIKELVVNPEIAYSFLVEYAKGKRIDINFREIDLLTEFNFNRDAQLNFSKKEKYNFLNEKDNHLIAKYKVKILSKQLKYYDIKKEVLEDFTLLLNHQNVSLGWALAEEMANISKYFEIDVFIQQLKLRCSEIFANENLWINTVSVLGLLSLKQVDVGDGKNIIEQALLYDNEFVSRSSLLREHTLFLVWSLLKRYLACKEKESGEILLEYFDLLVLVFILDSCYNVRRAAASVLAEFIGIFSFEYGYRLLNLIDKNYHKRLENAEVLIDHLSEFYKLTNFKRKFLESKLFHHNNEIKRATAYLIVKHYKPCEFFLYDDSHSVETRISALYVLSQSFNQKITNLDYTGLLSIKIHDRLFKTRNSEIFIFLYLTCLKQVVEYKCNRSILPIRNIYSDSVDDLDITGIQKPIILDNLFFLLTKGLFPHETCVLCWTLATDTFNKKLLMNLRRNNEAFILVNVVQENFPLEKYRSNLSSEDLDIRISTYKSIKYLNSPIIFKDQIERGLNDYSIDRRGDISYKIRLESLYLALFLELEVEKIILRYLVDKSKFLREFVLVLLSQMNLINFYKANLSKRNTAFTNFGVKCTGWNSELAIFIQLKSLNYKFSDPFVQFLKKFDEKFELNQKDASNKEQLYFETMLCLLETLSDDYKVEFYSGLCSTIIFSEKGISDFLLQQISNSKESIKKLIKNKEFPNISKVLTLENVE